MGRVRGVVVDMRRHKFPQFIKQLYGKRLEARVKTPNTIKTTPN